MKIDEFISRVSSEPERTLMQSGWEIAPQKLAELKSLKELKKPRVMMLTDLMAGAQPTQRMTTYRHILGPPASEKVIERWQKKHPRYPLPADLRALVARINGIHLWADVNLGRAYWGLAPIEEWGPARVQLGR